MASSSSMGSSKNLEIDTSSLRPFLLRVFTINSRARWGGGDGSNGRNTMSLSSGSPGTMFQWSNTYTAERGGKRESEREREREREKM